MASNLEQYVKGSGMERKEKACAVSCGILRKEIGYLLEKGDIDAEVHYH